MTSSTSSNDDGFIEIDFDRDGEPDVILKDTNGHSLYINPKFVYKVLAAIAASAAAVLALVI